MNHVNTQTTQITFLWNLWKLQKLFKQLLLKLSKININHNQLYIIIINHRFYKEILKVKYNKQSG